MDGERSTVWSIILSAGLFILYWYYYDVREGKGSNLEISKELQFQLNLQTKKKKFSQFTKTCNPMLSSGSYQNQSLDHTQCSQTESCKANAWLPNPKCTWHKYSTSDARKCFKNKKIQVIGDSRGRQMYLAMKDRLEGKGWVYDDLSFKSKTRDENKWRIESRIEESGTHIRWDWITKLPKNFGHQAHSLYWSIDDVMDKGEEEKSASNFPDLIIFESLLLHATRGCNNTEICNANFQYFKEAVQELIPFFKKVAKINRTKIIWMGNEDLRQIPDPHKRPDKYFKVDICNKIRREADVWMGEFFRSEFTEEELRSLGFISVAAETVWTESGKSGRIMLSNDNTHLLQREVNTTLTTALWVDANLIYNFVCNEVIRPEGVTCCV